MGKREQDGCIQRENSITRFTKKQRSAFLICLNENCSRLPRSQSAISGHYLRARPGGQKNRNSRYRHTRFGCDYSNGPLIPEFNQFARPALLGHFFDDASVRLFAHLMTYGDDIEKMDFQIPSHPGFLPGAWDAGFTALSRYLRRQTVPLHMIFPGSGFCT